MKLTGVGNELILKNAQLLSSLSKDMVIRVPVVPVLNDSDENLENTARFVKSLNGVLYVEFLPYNRFGEGKYQRLQKENPCRDIVPPSKERMKQVEAHFTSKGLKVTTGG